MIRDTINNVEIDAEGRLRVRPSNAEFPYVWRAAMEVYWDADSRTLFSPKPREWTYQMWFQQLIAAVRDEYDAKLMLSTETTWSNVPPLVRAEIEALPEWEPLFLVPINWEAAPRNDRHIVYVARHGGKACELRLNDFPTEAMFTLLKNGVEVLDFNDWPSDWGDRPSLRV
jgi:hypothetical protein